MTGTKLVMGASGFLGSHVTRKLVDRGDDVRVWIRESSSTVAFDDLQVERRYGDLGDQVALREAMRGAETVFYCIVDARAWLRDPTPLFATNVEALRGVLDVAVEVGVPKFVFCSTVGTIGLAEDGPAHEELPHNWRHLGGPYIESRLQAEELVLACQRDRGLPAVVLNVGTTYGPRDHVPTPHGKLVRAAARGKMPAYVRGASMEVVGVEDAATAFLLAEETGRIGERYIVSESYLPIKELFAIAADEGGVRPPRIGIPMPVMRVIGAVGGAVSRLRGTDSVVTPTSVRLMHIQSALDHSKATRELGWVPAPTEQAIRAGVRWFLDEDRGTSA
ncbi:NAD-dependent epimerase/dehydratase family protein [Nocardioides sp. HM23]|uniref:NAD-dependent epimerase/dehydratase family protein n=1 Tax=Nocardioides bizhenqiangii TaxID=3095076 RepID=UPI002ACA1C44|nr:NAD-dependent epimerase/dehydratase family protein [Nocardioides sp. HM23]MDZ5621293.1 NAD-dependent epimerase/dehydratase family protein [Nocardioides sp. HM23]